MLPLEEYFFWSVGSVSVLGVFGLGGNARYFVGHYPRLSGILDQTQLQP